MRLDEVIKSDDQPRSMRDPEVRSRRRALLDAPHMRPLTEYAARLRERGDVEVPEFDPLDGGIDALALFLFEKPGRMTAGSGSQKRIGSGFISRNNDDPTADATYRFMLAAGLPRKVTATWNIVPWWNGTRKIADHELRDGAACLRELMTILPKLRAVVLVGQKAAKARSCLADTGLALFQSDHPSPLVRASMPVRWQSIPSEWAKIKPTFGL